MGGGGASRLCNLPTYKSLMRLPDTKQPEAKSEMRSALLQYKYQAPDLSFLERNGLDNFWAFLANRIYPSWLAPNLITLCGGACVATAALLTIAHSPSLDGSSPQWVYVVDALLLWLYQSLDGSDGKQARKTKSGSPVGEMFDHGLDACAVGAIVVVSTDAFGWGIDNKWPWLALLCAQAGFFSTNLTLLHHGRMRVDLCGVIELQTAMISSLLLTAVGTPALWQSKLVAGYEIREALAMFTVLSIASSLCVCVRDVAIQNASLAARQEARRQCGAFALYACCVGTAAASLLSGEDEGGRTSALRLLLLCANSSFAEFMARVLMRRVALLPMPTFQPGLTALGFFAVSNILFGAHRPNMLTVFAVGAALAHASYFVCAIRSAANALGIHVFRVRGARSWCRL